MAVCEPCRRDLESTVLDLERLPDLMRMKRARDPKDRMSPLCAVLHRHPGLKAVLRGMSSSFPGRRVQSACAAILEEISQQIKYEQALHGPMCRRCLEGPKLCWACSGDRKQCCSRC